MQSRCYRRCYTPACVPARSPRAGHPAARHRRTLRPGRFTLAPPCPHLRMRAIKILRDQWQLAVTAPSRAPVMSFPTPRQASGLRSDPPNAPGDYTRDEAFVRRIIRAAGRRIAAGDVESLPELLRLAAELDRGHPRCRLRPAHGRLLLDRDRRPHRTTRQAAQPQQDRTSLWQDRRTVSLRVAPPGSPTSNSPRGRGWSRVSNGGPTPLTKQARFLYRCHAEPGNG